MDLLINLKNQLLWRKKALTDTLMLQAFMILYPASPNALVLQEMAREEYPCVGNKQDALLQFTAGFPLGVIMAAAAKCLAPNFRSQATRLGLLGASCFCQLANAGRFLKTAILKSCVNVFFWVRLSPGGVPESYRSNQYTVQMFIL